MSHNNDLVQTTKYYIYTAHTIYDDDKPFIEQFATKADALAKLEWYITNEIDMFNNEENFGGTHNTIFNSTDLSFVCARINMAVA